MSLFQGVKDYYSMLGARGVFLATRARLSKSFPPVRVKVPGIKHPVGIRLRTSDLTVLAQVLIIKEYACGFVKPPEVIIDGGANIGLTSIFYANAFPEAKILAVEPEDSNYRLLEQNISPYKNVIPVRAALWNECGEVKLVDSGLRHYGFQTIGKLASGEGATLENVPAASIEALMKEYSVSYIDLLKIDIEGSEKELFMAPATWIENVGVIAIELHDHLRSGCSETFAAASKGFKLVCSRGETLFVARDRFLVDGRSDGKNAAGFHVRPCEELPNKAVCRIVGAGEA